MSFYDHIQEEGRLYERVEIIFDVLEARGLPVPVAVRERIEACRDLDTLKAWTRLAAITPSADDLLAP